MNKLLLFLIFFFAFPASELSAQNAGNTKSGKTDTIQTASGADRVQALKVAFITKQLNLTSEEAEKFWPIYNEYQDKREIVRNQLQKDFQLIRDNADKMSNEELTRIADEEVALKVKDATLVSEMNEKLKKVLPAKKLAQLYVAEEDFKKELIRIITQDNSNKVKKQP